MQEEATLEWRVLYAENILRLEMLAKAFSAPPLHLVETTQGGELEPDGRMYVYKRTTEPVEDIVPEGHGKIGMFGAVLGDAGPQLSSTGGGAFLSTLMTTPAEKQRVSARRRARAQSLARAVE